MRSKFEFLNETFMQIKWTKGARWKAKNVQCIWKLRHFSHLIYLLTYVQWFMAHPIQMMGDRHHYQPRTRTHFYYLITIFYLLAWQPCTYTGSISTYSFYHFTPFCVTTCDCVFNSRSCFRLRKISLKTAFYAKEEKEED